MDKTDARFDSQTALERANGNVQLAQDLFRMLSEELPKYADEIRQHYQERAYVKLCDIVHKLNGASRYCGVPGLSQKASTFEIAIKQGNDSEYSRLMNELLDEIDYIINNRQEYNSHFDNM